MSKERAALIHSYLPDRDNPSKPDRYTRLGLLAGAELYRRDEVEKLCITVEERLAEAQVRRLKTLLSNMPEEDLVSKTSTVTTRQELQTFSELAEQNDWGELMSIARTPHIPRIEEEISKLESRKDIKTSSFESILDRFPRYKKVLSDMQEWPEEGPYFFYEMLMMTPVLGDIANKIGPHLGHFKVVLQRKFFQILENS